ncbi:MAG: DUF4214 domain-containing protein [Candidatus Humimicrobiaceae bacterium]
MYERIWLFLIPVYLIVSSSGIVFLFDFGIKRIKKAGFIIIPAIALILTISLSLVAFQSKSVFFSNDTGTLFDAEKITLFLKNELKPKDRILLERPSEWPMYYYFDKYNISSNYFSSDINQSIRIIVLINKSNEQSLESVINFNKINIDKFSKPQILQKFDYSTLLYSKRDLNSFITSIFKNFLNREPNQDELNLWVSGLSLKEKTAVNFLESIIQSGEFKMKNISDSEYVKILYKALLNREPDNQGYNGWLDNLKNGKTRQYVLSGFINSNEFGDFCQLYDILPINLN